MSVPEDTSPGTVVQVITASDADSADTDHGQVIFTIVSGAHPLWELESTTGQIRLAGTVCYNMELRKSK